MVCENFDPNGMCLLQDFQWIFSCLTHGHRCLDVFNDSLGHDASSYKCSWAEGPENLLDFVVRHDPIQHHHQSLANLSFMCKHRFAIPTYVHPFRWHSLSCNFRKLLSSRTSMRNYFSLTRTATTWFNNSNVLKLRACRIGANLEKSDLVHFRGPGWRKFSELSVLLFFAGKVLTKYSQNPGLVNQFSASPRGQLNWTGPTANGSEKHAHAH